MNVNKSNTACVAQIKTHSAVGNVDGSAGGCHLNTLVSSQEISQATCVLPVSVFVQLFFFIMCPCIKFNAKSGTQTQIAEGEKRDSLGFGMISSCKYATGTKARSVLVITSVPSLDTTPPSFSPPSNTPATGLSQNQMKRGPEQSCFVCVYDGMLESLL